MKATQKIEDMKIPFTTQFDIAQKLAKHIVPIMIYNEEDKVKFNGSAVYIVYNNTKYLCTAEHVVSGVENNRVLILPEYGKAISIPSTIVIKSNYDEGDIVIYKLNVEIKEFIPVNYNDISDSDFDGEHITLIGFAGKNVKENTEGTLFNYSIIFSNIAEDGYKYFSNFNKEANFVCNYRKKNVLVGTGDIVTLPDPNGMSGGGAFETKYDNNNEIVSCRLVGIMTEWNPVIKKFIKCTNGRIIKFMISRLEKET